MNIGFLYGLDIGSPRGGGNVHGHFLARELVARGHKLFSWYVANGDTPLCTHFRGRQVLSFLRTIDVLYIRVEWNLGGAKLGRFLKLLRPTLPVIWELNGHPSELLFSQRTEADLEAVTRGLRRNSLGVRAAICVVDEICEYARDSLGIRNVRCIPNGSATDIFVPRASPDRRDDRPLHAVWIGTSRAGWHNLEAIFEAARILRRENANVMFSIYGDPSHLPATMPDNVMARGQFPYYALGAALGSTTWPAGSPSLPKARAREAPSSIDGSAASNPPASPPT
jgi:glycosyltransferase involved in cell wall biosynthesis